MSLLNKYIIFENEFFIAINKPAGMLSIPDREQSQPSLKDLLIEKYGSIFTIHRLDKDTSGLILFAKDEAAHKYFSKQFEEKNMEKYYVGLVHGSFSDATGSIDAPIMEHLYIKGKMIVNKKGKASLTDFELMENFGKYSLVKFRIHTGRTHQIRVHTANIGHPLVCDPLYGDGKPFLLSAIKKKYNLSKIQEEEKPMINRVALHSYQLIFKDANHLEFNLIAPLPKDMFAAVQQLKKNKRA
jgi:23S rRNA pseudouridine955/2504/2580 synthase/23S rRNA pseudouridine1911/1915/1917 synthase